MKLTTLMLFLAIMQVSATSLAQKVTLAEKNSSLDAVFEKIHTQTGYDISLTSSVLKVAKKVTINVKNIELKDVLNLIFQDQPLEYQLEQKSILVKIKNVSSLEENVNLAVPIKISGQVTDSLGRALSSASVLNKATNKGTVTDSDGNFTIEVNEGDVIVISYIGFQSYQFKAHEKLPFQKVVLYNAVSKLSEVTVNTGYQTIRKERFVGAVSQLDSAAYSRRAGTSILDRLDGTVTGILFDRKSQGTGASIQVRGISTLANAAYSPASTPLIIVDNFPYTGDLSSINQNDIESISVLKDAAAASIWGTQAGNGVIVINTKKGKYNQAFKVSVSSNITFQEKPDLFYIPQISSSDEIDVEKYLFQKGFYDAALTDPTYPVVSPIVEILNKQRNGTISQTQADAQINQYRTIDLREQLNQYFYKSPILQQHYVNFSGGGNTMNYNLSTGYNNNMSNIQGSKGSEQFTINSNLNFHPTKKLEISTGINYSQTIDKSAGISLPNLYPYAQLKDAKGNHLAVANALPLGYVDTVGNGQLLDWHYRPLDEIQNADNDNKLKYLRLNIGISYRLTSWLSAGIKYQYFDQSQNDRDYFSQQTFYARSLINGFTNLSQTDPHLRNPIPIGGILNTSNAEIENHNARAELNINKAIGTKGQLTGLVAGELSRSDGTSSNTLFYGYNNDVGVPNQTIDYLDYFQQYNGQYYSQIPNGNINPGIYNRYVSVLANLSYTYDDKYTIYASGRRDGSNVFGVNTNNKWKPLLSTGASWDISKESFYDLNWMSYLRLRGSFGYSGNVNNGLSGQPTIIFSGNANGTNLKQAQVGNAPNPDLKWEQVRILNIGLDFGLFKSRLNGNVDVFRKNSTDLISPIPFDPTSGVSLYTVNSASLAGNGFEINLNSKNTTGIIKWESQLGISCAKMIVTKIYNGGFRTSDFFAYNVNPAVGKVAYGISSYRWAGLDPATGDPQGYLNGVVSKDYTALANDSIKNQVFNGSAIPLYSGFFGNSVTWKNFTLSANITFRLDYYFRRPTLSYYNLFSNWQGTADYSKRWQKPGDEKITNVPSMVYPDDPTRDAFYQNSSINVLRGDNIKLQDVRVQYNWINRNMKNMPITSAQIFFYANNLNVILWRANKAGLDPDVSGGTNPLAIPIPRTWTIGANLNF